MSAEVSPTQKSITPYLMPGAILLSGVMVAYAIFATQGSVTPEGAVANVGAPTEVLPAKEGKVLAVSDDDHVYGPQDPDVYLIEYSDYRCGYCGMFHETIKEILQTYEGKVAWVYRHTPFQPGGMQAAVASECIAELAGEDAFWEFSERVFGNQRGLSDAWYAETAGELGAESGAYQECIASGRYNDLIAQHTKNASELGSKGTPYSVLLTKNGEVVKFAGAQPVESVKIFVNQALNLVK